MLGAHHDLLGSQEQENLLSGPWIEAYGGTKRLPSWVARIFGKASPVVPETPPISCTFPLGPVAW